MSSDLASVRLELTIDHMRHGMIQHLQLQQEELQKLVDDEMKRIIESDVLGQHVRECVRKHVGKALDDAVRNAVHGWSENSPTVQRAIESAITAALWRTEDEATAPPPPPRGPDMRPNPTDRASGLPMNVETCHLLERAKARMFRLGNEDEAVALDDMIEALTKGMTETEKWLLAHGLGEGSENG